jgi:hypothetical protein
MTMMPDRQIARPMSRACRTTGLVDHALGPHAALAGRR